MGNNYSYPISESCCRSSGLPATGPQMDHLSTQTYRWPDGLTYLLAPGPHRQRQEENWRLSTSAVCKIKHKNRLSPSQMCTQKRERRMKCDSLTTRRYHQKQMLEKKCLQKKHTVYVCFNK